MEELPTLDGPQPVTLEELGQGGGAPCWACAQAGGEHEFLRAVRAHAADDLERLGLRAVCAAVSAQFERRVRAPALAAGIDPGPWSAADVRRHLTEHEHSAVFEAARQVEDARALAAGLRSALFERDGERLKPDVKAIELYLRTTKELRGLLKSGGGGSV